jgi:hypothetical protein
MKNILAKSFSSLELTGFDLAFPPQILEPQRVAGKLLRNKDLEPIINLAARRAGETPARRSSLSHHRTTELWKARTDVTNGKRKTGQIGLLLTELPF